MNLKKYYSCFFVIFLIASSCASKKKVILFQDAVISSKDTSVSSSDFSTLRIQPFDVLDIRVISSEKALGNLTESKAVIPLGSGVGGYFSGYYVNERGIINLPLIGDVSLQNLTIDEAKIKLQDKLKQYLINPFVDIKFLTFKVTMLGEVGRPGVVTIPNEKANLIDAIALAGDITEFGDRTKIMILRGEASKPIIFELNLTSIKSFKQPGFILMPNDVIYIKPTDRKFNIANLALTLSAITVVNTITILLNFLL